MHAVHVSDAPAADEARFEPQPPGGDPASPTTESRVETGPPPAASGSVPPARVAGLSPDIVHFRTETADRINALARAGLQSFLAHAREVGALLIEVKAQLTHGAFIRWVEHHCTFSHRTAVSYTKVAANWPTIERELAANPQSSADLSLKKALELVSRPRRGSEPGPSQEGEGRARAEPVPDRRPCGKAFVTIGYEDREPGDLLDLLVANGVRTVVDVRLRPDREEFATYRKGRNADEGIEELLSRRGIRYTSRIELGNLFVDDEDWRPRYRELLARAGDLLVARLEGLPGPCCFLGAGIRAEECHRRLIADYLVAVGGWNLLGHLE